MARNEIKNSTKKRTKRTTKPKTKAKKPKPTKQPIKIDATVSIVDNRKRRAPRKQKSTELKRGRVGLGRNTGGNPPGIPVFSLRSQLQPTRNLVNEEVSQFQELKKLRASLPRLVQAKRDLDVSKELLTIQNKLTRGLQITENERKKLDIDYAYLQLGEIPNRPNQGILSGLPQSTATTAPTTTAPTTTSQNPVTTTIITEGSSSGSTQPQLGMISSPMQTLGTELLKEAQEFEQALPDLTEEQGRILVNAIKRREGATGGWPMAFYQTGFTLMRNNKDLVASILDFMGRNSGSQPNKKLTKSLLKEGGIEKPDELAQFVFDNKLPEKTLDAIGGAGKAYKKLLPPEEDDEEDDEEEA